MKKLSLFDDSVEIVVTEVCDGNMKAVPSMDPAAVFETQHNRNRAAAQLDLLPTQVALLRVSYEQTDFCKFIHLDAATGNSLDDGFEVGFSDGIMTCSPDLGILLPLADCLGMILYDPHHTALMMVHCGRHTLLQQGAARAVAFMQKQACSRPSDLRAYLSPCAGKENYPLFDADGKGLQEYAAEQLIAAGLRPENIEHSPIDTTLSEHFFSHSQGDTVNRFALCAKRVAGVNRTLSRQV